MTHLTFPRFLRGPLPLPPEGRRGTGTRLLAYLLPLRPWARKGLG
jgi:hypothetical protein